MGGKPACQPEPKRDEDAQFIQIFCHTSLVPCVFRDHATVSGSRERHVHDCRHGWSSHVQGDTIFSTDHRVRKPDVSCNFEALTVTIACSVCRKFAESSPSTSCVSCLRSRT